MAGDCITTNGTVIKACGNAMFLVNVPEFKKEIKCFLSGKIKKNTIRINEGDRVSIEISMYDTSKGRIVFRYKRNIEQ
jgi:translation initiation factor IF-1